MGRQGILKHLDVCPFQGFLLRVHHFLNFPVSLISVEKDWREEEHVFLRLDG
jgi:hypothetical protein